MLKIIKLFDYRQKRTFLIILFLIILSSFLEILNLSILLPILNSFLGIENSSREQSLLGIIEFFGLKNYSINLLLFLFLFFFVLKTFFSVFVSWKHHNFVFDVIKKLSFNLYAKYLSQSFNIYSSKNSSEFLRNVLKEIDLFYLSIQSFIMVILEIIILSGIILFLLFFLTFPTLIIIVLSFFLGLIYYIIIKNRLVDWGKNRQQLEQNRIRFMQEGFNCIKEINFFNRHNFFLERFKKANDSFYRIYLNFSFINTIPRYVFELFTIALIVFVFFVLVVLGKDNYEIIKILALFFAASFRIIPSAYRIFSGLQNLRYTNPSINVLFKDFKSLKLKVTENDFDLKFKKDIKLTAKNFKYNHEDIFNLENIEIKIKKNHKIGIIGKSGSGKSTILNLITGIINKNLETVSLKIDDVNLNDENKIDSWQKKIGLISQNISILNETLEQNILFGLNNNIISKEKILQVIKITNLEGLLNRLPSGLEHNISEKGSNLSGGEIQRIAIARALIFDPEVLIFDEATSALDTFTENEILEDINKLENKTIIMVSHRINTLKFCDEIFYIEDGKILKKGSFIDFKINN